MTWLELRSSPNRQIARSPDRPITHCTGILATEIWILQASKQAGHRKQNQLQRQHERKVYVLLRVYFMLVLHHAHTNSELANQICQSVYLKRNDRWLESIRHWRWWIISNTMGQFWRFNIRPFNIALYRALALPLTANESGFNTWIISAKN